MSAADTADHDYSTGVPRRHHSLYIEDGNLVFQVESAIFKVHRSFLVKSSPVIKDMLNVPHPGNLEQADDGNPLVLTGDSAAGWVFLLESHYESNSLLGEQDVNGERLLAILPIAHKYCMGVMEGGILKQLERVKGTAGYVDLLVASRIIDSKALYDQALNALFVCPARPTLDQARRIGMEAYFAVMENQLTRCRHAGPTCRYPHAGITRQCRGCQQLQ